MTNRSLFALALILSTFELFSQERKLQAPSSSDTTRRPVKAARAKQTIPQAGGSSPRIGSQIVDDTTKSIYGPQTTLWTTEHEIFTGRRRYTTLDSSISNFHRWTYVQQFSNFYQDLGNNGTALHSIFPTLSTETIGVSPGFSAYELYFRTEEPKLFNTKSPYTRMYGVWGGAGRAATGVEYSRNINPTWNFSFNYRPILTDKQILRQGKGDRHVISHYYDISSHYATPKEKYEAFVSYRRIRHRVNENGGISFVIPTGQDSSYNNFFGTVSPVLVAAISLEQRNQLHLFHQYLLGKSQVYHIMDISKQVNWFKDDLNREVNDFYDNIQIDSPESVLDSVRFSFHQHQIGVKGQIGKSKGIFYNGYYKIKAYNQFYNYLNVDTIAIPGKASEHYVGGQVQYNLDSTQSVSFWSEFLGGGFLRLEAEARTRWLDFTARKLISKPTFLQTAYSGHFDLWNNDFSPTQSLQAAVFPKIIFGPLFVSPGVTFTSLTNYIYFKEADFPNTLQKVLPVQINSKIELATWELRMDLGVIKKIHLRPQLLYTHILSNPDNAVRIPVLFMNGQLAFEDELFKGNLQVQIGFDFHWHSAYKAMGYDPAIQSFYNQDRVITPEYLLGDFFFNGKMKRGRFFVKYHNFFQLFTQVGQMPTPYYRATKNILDFGFDLLLFD